MDHKWLDTEGATGSETCFFYPKIKMGWSSVPTDHFIKGKLSFNSSLVEMKNDGIASLLFMGLFLTDGNERKRETKQAQLIPFAYYSCM